MDSLNRIDIEILNIDKVICRNIDRFDSSDRGLLSQNILSQLRNFVEHISLKAYANGQDIENSYPNIEKANIYVKSRGNLRFLSKFHRLLQITASHYTLDEENSERLMLKYFEYLLKMKNFLKSTYNLDILENIDEFPIITDSNLNEYYEKIIAKINQPSLAGTRNTYNDRYYIQKIKPFFVDYEVYYEVTFTIANDKASKFDRIIAFTKLDLSHNYAVKLSVKNEIINILDKNMPILIIDSWEVSIRPCELNNFADIFGNHPKIQSGSIEYRELMRYLTESGMNLVELIDLADDYYNSIKTQINQRANTLYFFDIIDKCREFTKSNSSGNRVIRYLLYRLNNKIIKQQYMYRRCERLSQLHLDYGCIPFDNMPFNTSLKNHNPKLSDLLDCIDVTNREHEIFARLIKNNIELKGQLYTSKKDIEGFGDIDGLMQTYNNMLYYKHGHRRLENYKNNIYIKGYEVSTLSIIQKLKELASAGIDNYLNSVEYWLQYTAYNVDCDEKEHALKQMFENSKVALIYGAAGTGKSTMINHISNFFNDKKKLYLANTNPAVDNLKRRVNADNCTYKTIAKFNANKNCETEFDVLIIDECSTVSNIDMLRVINKASFKLLVLVGDVYQIDSIVFGNWFNVVASFVPETSIYELTNPYRTNNPNLLTLWDKVRSMNEDILEHITKNNYSISLDESIFEHFEEDEIILCLNYDGLYGINNINRFLQSSNQNIPVRWGVQTYKINDPVLFNESERFTPLIYNNLKGKIVGIETFNDRIQFDIELDKVMNQLDVEGYDLELIGHSDQGNSVIRFFVNKYRSTDEDDDSSSEAVVPFQVAYAVSIHKAQGLEYNSVKIVITDESEEMITHNIFYTAITRAKGKLKIYWTPETENKILNNLERKNSNKDVALLRSKIIQPVS
ncbi:ATP-dependent DNA helicase [Virgibacillus sp. CM-4]|uniref:ATP-dependent DNA helicase n=1 Tax=Virgibacillus sp. CM-4 TaxID=1354277 RepID=UPI001E36676B|nr:ATP-dependent RecD-like DNA helicase [Virgibacillus sp. CM-4]